MSDERLIRAMRASAAPARDPSFALAVLERAEQARFRRASLQAMLHGAGVATAGAAGVLLFGAWANTHPASVADGLTWTAAIIAAAWLAQGLIGRLRGTAS